MTPIFNGRYTAQSDVPLTLFLIGMRINRLRAVGRWWPVVRAMPAMLRELDQKPDSGLLKASSFIGGRTVLVLQYWRSFEDLLRYAHDKEGVHFPAWAAYNRKVGQSGIVGIWHETYRIEPGRFESIYSNMPLFGLAAATNHMPATGRLAGARERMTSLEASNP